MPFVRIAYNYLREGKPNRARVMLYNLIKHSEEEEQEEMFLKHIEEYKEI